MCILLSYVEVYSDSKLPINSDALKDTSSPSADTVHMVDVGIDKLERIQRRATKIIQ